MDFDFNFNLFGNSSSRRVGAPCPQCKKHIHKGDVVCNHCGYKLEPIEILNANYYRSNQTKFGVKSGLVLFPVAFAMLVLFFWLIT